ncbi:MAG TPA: MarR family transcriptional regulator [Myxococcota bacterium]|nr:MarR family transcriptional regulator [Myxococcota bacterium]
MADKSSYEDSILRSLRKITRAIDLHSRRLASQFGLTGPQLVCLRVLENQGPLTPGKLAREVALSQGTITGIVDRLLNRQLVTRERSQADRRSVSVAITRKGLEMIETAPSPLQESFALRLRKLPQENQLVIHTILNQIVRMMDAEKLDAAPMLSSGDPSVPASSVEEFLEQNGSELVPLRLAENQGDQPAADELPAAGAGGAKEGKNG